MKWTRATTAMLLAAVLLCCAAGAAANQQTPAGVVDHPVDEGAPPSSASPGAASPAPTAPIPLEAEGPPPWLTNSAAAPRPPLRDSAGPRDLLVNIADSEYESFFDGAALDPANSALIKILFRLPRFDLADVHRFTHRDADWSELAADPDSRRIEMFRLRGRVKRIEREQFPAELAERFEFSHYFRVYFHIDGPPDEALVCARVIPEAWRIDAPLDERAACDAVFLQTARSDDDAQQLVFAADRIAWLPDRVDPPRGITGDHVLLGDLGMDVGLFDQVRPLNRRPLGSADRECFYQLLSAAGRATPQQLAQADSAKLDLGPTLRQPEKLHGELLSLEGTARRIMKVRVADEDIQQRFGIDHYYEIDMFLPLGDTTVRLGREQEGKTPPEFKNVFPVTVCAVQLPPGLTESENLNETIRVTGFFFKLWMYKSQFISQFDPRQRQPAPMLVALRPQLVQRGGVNPLLGLAGGLLFVAALGVVWYALWRSSRSDSRFERDVIRLRLQRKQNKSLNDLGIESQDGPDFSNLD